MIIDSPLQTENEPAHPEHSEVGTTPTAFLPDILVSLNQLSQKQNEMAGNLEIFKSEQVGREMVLSANIAHITRELAEIKNNQTFICRTLENQYAYTSPSIYAIGNLMNNFANVVKTSDIPSCQPHVTDPGSSGCHVAGTNFYPAQGHPFDLNKGSGSTPGPMSYHNHQFNTLCDLATIHGMTTGGPSVPVHQGDEFDASLDFFQGKDAES